MLARYHIARNVPYHIQPVKLSFVIRLVVLPLALPVISPACIRIFHSICTMHLPEFGNDIPLAKVVSKMDEDKLCVELKLVWKTIQ